MADILKLALTDHTATGSKIDLLNGTIKLRRGGWQPKIATPKQSYQAGWYGAQAAFEQFDPVLETLDLLGDDTVANLIAADRALQAMLDRARTWAMDPVQEQALWLEWSTDSEPGAGTYAAKRAMIYGGTLQMSQPDQLRGGFLNGQYYATLALSRHPFWENITAKEITGSSKSLTGGQVTLTSYADGTAPARIPIFILENTSESTDLSDVWIGIRDEHHGITDFEPVWELEDGTAGTDTSAAVDATASGGDKMTCTFGTTATLASRLTMTVGQAIGGGTDEIDFVGRYLVLGRVKVGSSTECGLRLDFGMANDLGYHQGDPVYIDNTAWALVELGEIRIPTEQYRNGTSATYIDPGHFKIRLMAERLSGSNSLDLDCLILIPSEHMVKVRNATATKFRILTVENDTRVVQTETQAGLTGSAEWSVIDWYLPIDPGFLVVAGQRSTGHVLTDTVNLWLYYHPRWFSYRGAV